MHTAGKNILSWGRKPTALSGSTVSRCESVPVTNCRCFSAATDHFCVAQLWLQFQTPFFQWVSFWVSTSPQPRRVSSGSGQNTSSNIHSLKATWTSNAVRCWNCRPTNLLPLDAQRPPGGKLYSLILMPCWKVGQEVGWQSRSESSEHHFHIAVNELQNFWRTWDCAHIGVDMSTSRQTHTHARTQAHTQDIGLTREAEEKKQKKKNTRHDTKWFWYKDNGRPLSLHTKYNT